MTERYRELNRAVNTLRRAFLPYKFDPTGAYRDSVHLRAGAFRVMCHAEIEAYLEDVASDLLTEAWQLWATYGYATQTLTCLIGFSGIKAQMPPKSLDPDREKADIRNLLEKANNVWRTALRRNHGIKERNVLRLFLPLGIELAELDTTLLADLNSFGIGRGEIAHSSAIGAAKGFDPKSEYETVRGLLKGLRSIDSAVELRITTLKSTRRQLENA